MKKIKFFGQIVLAMVVLTMAQFTNSSCFFANYPKFENASFQYSQFYSTVSQPNSDTVIFTLQLSDSSLLNQYKTIGKVSLTSIQTMFNYYSGTNYPYYFGKLYYSDTKNNNLKLVTEFVENSIAGNYNYFYPLSINDNVLEDISEILSRDEAVSFYFIGQPSFPVISCYFNVLFEVYATVYPNV